MIDLGTEFGVRTDTDGSRLDVFQGLVEMQSLSSDGQVVASAQVSSNQSALIVAGETSIRTTSSLTVYSRNLARPHPFSEQAGRDVGGQPSVLALQIDVGDRSGAYQGADSPAHHRGDLAAEQNTWSSVETDVRAGLRFADGSIAHRVSIDFGHQHNATGPVLWWLDPGDSESGIHSHEDEVAPLYDNVLMRDWMYTNDNNHLGVRVAGLPAGWYRVYAIVREGNALDRTYDVAIGVDLDGFTPATTTSLGEARDVAEWRANVNYATRDVEVRRESDRITILIDPTNESFATLQCLQIVAIEPPQTAHESPAAAP
jgi:hypothetical protein